MTADSSELLSVYHQWVDGYSLEKFVELRQILYTKRYDVVVLTGVLAAGDIFSANDISTAEIPTYELYCSELDTASSTTGGICVYINEDIKCWSVSDPELNIFRSALWFNLENRLLLGFVYYDGTATVSKFSVSLAAARKATSLLGQELSLLTPVVSLSLPGNNTVSSSRADSLQQLLGLQGYHRQSVNKHECKLTVCTLASARLSDTTGCNFNSLEPLGTSLVSGLTHQLNIKPTRLHFSGTYPDYKEANYGMMQVFLSRKNWKRMFGKKMAHNALRIFQDELDEAIKNHVPQAHKKKDTRAPWARDAIDWTREMKSSAWHKENKQLYQAYATQLKRLIIHEKIELEKALIARCQVDSDIINEFTAKRGPYSSILCMKAANQTQVIYNDKEIADRFGEFFQSIYKENFLVVPRICMMPLNYQLSTFSITAEMVEDVLSKIDSKDSVGPDKISYHALKNLASVISAPLAYIFTRCIETNDFPYIWGSTKIRPKFKGGPCTDKVLFDKYRPLSITSNVCKVFEKVIVRQISSHMKEHGLMQPHQHAYREDRSVTTNLIDTMHFVTKALNDRHAVDIIYLDLRKAFDTVPHNMLLEEIKRYGICGKLNDFIKKFLTCRRQFVRINKEQSDKAAPTSGVPQGSVLANMLFILFLNSLPTLIHADNHISMYSDDIKLHGKVSGLAGRRHLQDDLLKLSGWASRARMSFSIEKCKVMHLGNNNPRGVYYMVDGGVPQLIEEVKDQVQRDLGVFVDSSLSFTKHVEIIVGRAMESLDVMKNKFTHLTKDVFIWYYDQYVRSKLESSSPVWSPISKKDQDCIENVQYLATKLVTGMEKVKSMTYSRRLKELELPTLQFRRMRADLLQIYRFITEANEMMATVPINPNDRILGTTPGASDVRAHFLFERVAPRWNRLSQRTVFAEDLDQFKLLLDEELEGDEKYEYYFSVGFSHNEELVTERDCRAFVDRFAALHM